MPTQFSTTTVPEYAMFDTAPALPVTLVDGAGDAIDLTGSTVVINVTPTSNDYGDQDPNRLVNGGACVVDPDQVNNKGEVTWAPLSTDFSRWGSFAYNFEVTYPDGKRQTISPKGENVLIVRYPIGGVKYAEEVV